MAWFKYIKYGETLPSINYKYPLVKRRIVFPKPKQTIDKDTWVYVQLNDLKIDKIINNLAVEETDSRSYLVIYESKAENGEDFVFVESEIVGNILYFKTAENHEKDTEINKQYSLYYRTKKIKNLKKVVNNSKDELQEVDELLSDYPSSSEVENSYYTFADVFEIKNYAFSFLNQNTDWLNGESKSQTSKAIGIFTGPELILKCHTGPDYGVFKISITRNSDDATPVSQKVIDQYTVDCYSETYGIKNVYVNNSLDYKEYIFEIESNYQKNPLSSSGKIKIDSFYYLYNPFLSLDLEQVNSNLLTRKIAGVI